ncbi:MAG TPA: phosphate ABC transporter permease subunit PstC [Actinomycetota bacterium]
MRLPGGSGAAERIEGLRGDPRRRRRERSVGSVFFAAAALSVVVSAAIVLSLAGEAASFLSKVDPSSLWSEGWFPRRSLYDLRTIVGGTIMVAGVAMVVAAPLGLFTAMYLSELASPRARRWLKPVVEVLAGIPSVVLGYVALAFINPELVQRFLGGTSPFSMLGAGVAVGILVTPLVASVAEDALHAVPQALREASSGLGAKRTTTTVRVVFPAAVSGIVAALILGLSRAIGETMIVAIASGSTGGSLLSFDIVGPGQTMTGAMTALAVGSDRVAVGGGGATVNPVDALFFVGLLLFVMTFALNVVSERLVRRMRV